MPWRSLAAALLLGVAGPLAAAPVPAAAWSDGACPTDDGVTVVVDFSAFGDGIVIRCAPGDPESGLDVLAAAGLSVEQVHSVPGFVCRIDGLPDADSESCATTPPISASWSYWHAARGGSWTYNVVGAGASQPAPGSVEGWAFTTGSGAASPPGVPPPPAPANPKPAPTAAITPRPTAKPTAAPTPVATAAVAASPTASASTTATASPMASATPAVSPQSAPSSSATSTPTTAAAPGADVAAADASPPVGTVAGIGLALAAGGAAIVVQRRRRLRPSG